MNRRSLFGLTILVSGLAVGWVFFFVPQAARADEIVLVVDEHGNRIFMNTSEPARRPIDWRLGGYRSKRSSIPRTPPADITSLVEKTANRYEVDPQLVHAIIQVESEYNPHAVSRKGALGLMQLIPKTAALYGVSNAFDPAQNINAGVSHLKFLLNYFGGDIPLSLAAYNSGARTVERFGGIPSFPETKNYVKKVWSLYQIGGEPPPARVIQRQAAREPINQFMDAQGVVHFSNVE